jgi:hypothetical protein
MRPNDKNLDRPADLVSFYVIPWTKRILCELIEKSDYAVSFQRATGAQFDDNICRNKNAIGRDHLSSPAPNSFFNSSSRTQLASFWSSIFRVISARQAGSSLIRRCRRKAANSCCCCSGRLATTRINSAMLTPKTLHFEDPDAIPFKAFAWLRPSRQKAGPSWLRFRRPCSKYGKSSL